jgi:hypothetical protein
MDEYAQRSQELAVASQESGFFDREIVAVTLPDGTVVEKDDGPRASSTVEKLGELSEKPDELRNLVRELRLPKEVLSELFSQVDDTKTGLYRVVAKELRDVLEHTQIAEEIVKVLTKLSFEIKTEIRFVPNDRSAEASDDATGGDDSEGEAGTGAFGLRPKVTADVSVKERGRREGR